MHSKHTMPSRPSLFLKAGKLNLNFPCIRYMMGKSFSKNRSDNEGTQEVDQSRRLEVGLVNFDSHSSMSSIGWYKVLELLGFVLMCLFVMWEAKKYS